MSNSSVANRAPVAHASEDRALATRVVTDVSVLEPTSEPIADPRAFTSRLDQLAERFNIIAPPVQVVGGFQPGWTITASVVRINTSVNEDGQGPETYVDRGFMKPNQRALNKVGLLKVASAAGVKWTSNTGRRDDGSQPYLWQYFAEGLVDTPDGSYQIISGEVEIDFRDGSPQIGEWTPEKWEALLAANRSLSRDQQQKSINGWTHKRLIQARGMGLRLAETKAKNRAIRSLGLQQVYTEKELSKPFVVFRAQYTPDLSDPEIRRMVAHRALHGRQTLYPASVPVPAQSLPAAPFPPVGTLPAVASVSASAPEIDPPAADAAPVGCTVVKVDQVIHDGKPRDLWDVSFSDGRVARARDTGLVRFAQQAQDQAWLVEPVCEPSAQRPGGLNLVELARVEASATSDESLY